MKTLQDWEIGEGVLGTIGRTPLVKLQRLFPGDEAVVFGKLEALNPGGSIKDRPAKAVLEAALASGDLAPGSVVVESSSGNMGIGLAQACRYYGLRFICVVDSKTTHQNLSILRAYGAEIDRVTEPDPETGELLQARLHRVQALLEKIPGSFWPNQYANHNNPAAHRSTTMREICEALDGRVDYLFVGTSTCGTIRGCAEYVEGHGLATRVVAVDALGSRIFGDQQATRRIPGLGAGIQPPLCAPELIDDVVHVDDVDCILGCHLLAEREAILAGGSSGGVVSAALRYRPRFEPGSRCVLILPDRGERYLDTIYDEVWVSSHYGDLAALVTSAEAPEVAEPAVAAPAAVTGRGQL